MATNNIKLEKSNSSSNCYENNIIHSRWVSNDQLKLVKVTSSFDNFIEYSEAGSIKKVKSHDFEKEFKQVDLDSRIYNGIPISYMGNDPIWF